MTANKSIQYDELTARDLPWEKMSRILLQCGGIHEPQAFCARTIQDVRTLIPFDQGRVYFFNDNGLIYDEILLDVDKRVTRAYHGYYAKVADGCYDAAKRVRHAPETYLPVWDWFALGKSDEFLQDHLAPQGIRYSTGFLFHDLLHTPKVLFCMDRTGTAPYSPQEAKTLYYLTCHLRNLYCNFYTPPPDSSEGVKKFLEADQPLTPRETEIAGLLASGISPEHIAGKLCISRGTVYKHISHIHAKLHVSTQQELLVKWLAH